MGDGVDDGGNRGSGGGLEDGGNGSGSGNGLEDGGNGNGNGNGNGSGEGNGSGSGEGGRGTFRAGDRFVFRFRKWDGSEHWSVPAVWLGEDEHGQWFGQHPGTLSSRPGASFITDTPNVSLVPDGTPWVATFYPPGHHDHVEVYIDLAADVVLTPERQSGIDMDLDVIRTDDARGTWIDDEDEFEDHAEAMSYPADVIDVTATAAAALRVEVESRIEPFDRTPFRWLAVLATLPS